MRQPATTWGGFIRIVIAAVLADIVVYAPIFRRSYWGQWLLFFLVMVAIRSYLDVVEPAARRLLTRRKPPSA